MTQTSGERQAEPRRDYGWQDNALCAETDPEAFYRDDGQHLATARVICGLCPVREQCLNFAITHYERGGMWGGMTQDERDAENYRRRRRAMRARAA